MASVGYMLDILADLGKDADRVLPTITDPADLERLMEAIGVNLVDKVEAHWRKLPIPGKEPAKAPLADTETGKIMGHSRGAAGRALGRAGWTWQELVSLADKLGLSYAESAAKADIGLGRIAKGNKTTRGEIAKLTQDEINQLAQLIGKVAVPAPSLNGFAGTARIYQNSHKRWLVTLDGLKPLPRNFGNELAARSYLEAEVKKLHN
jgi:hypothetical protein